VGGVPNLSCLLRRFVIAPLLLDVSLALRVPDKLIVCRTFLGRECRFRHRAPTQVNVITPAAVCTGWHAAVDIEYVPTGGVPFIAVGREAVNFAVRHDPVGRRNARREDRVSKFLNRVRHSCAPARMGGESCPPPSSSSLKWKVVVQ